MAANSLIPEVNLYDHAGRYTTVQGLEDRLEALTRMQVLQRNDLPKRAKDPAVAVFVERGLVRLYADDGTKERTLQFGLEGWWVSDWQAFFSGQGTDMQIQAVENASLVVLTPQDYERLLEDCPTLERYFRRIFARSTAAFQHRIWLNETLSAGELYEHFRQKNSDFFQRVPQYMLASYLGFSAEFFSKIRSGKLKGKAILN